MTKQCHVCGKKMGGVLGANRVEAESINFARSAGVDIPDVICMPCFIPLRLEANRLRKEANPIDVNTKKLEELLSSIRISTYPPGEGDDYEYRALITSQSAIGTGPINQLVSSWTDFFGMESEAYCVKLRQGEDSCIKKLQQQAIEHNANAVAGVQITYTELTRGHGMVLVCMAGTAIYIRGTCLDIKERYDTLVQERRILRGDLSC